MKVILLQDVKKVGKKDEIVNVKDGYAKNKLIPEGLAVEASKEAMKQLNSKIQKANDEYQHDKEEAVKIKDKLESKEFKFQLKAGKNGEVFGSISSKQIVKKLTDEGFKVDKKMIKSDSISHLGYDRVIVKLHKEVEAEIKILVIEG